jgi:hypothetical protein
MIYGITMGQGQKLGSNLKSDTFGKKSYRNHRPKIIASIFPF